VLPSGWCLEIRGLYPPLVGSRELRELVGASFKLVPVNKGVGSSFQLVLENLEVGASYECILDIYKKSFLGFLPFGFPSKFWCIVYLMVIVDCYCLWLYSHDILNAIINDILVIKLKFIYCD
jgi:hypothetical protein